MSLDLNNAHFVAGPAHLVALRKADDTWVVVVNDGYGGDGVFAVQAGRRVLSVVLAQFYLEILIWLPSIIIDNADADFSLGLVCRHLH